MDSLNVSSLIITSLFGAVGFVAFVYGKKESLWKTMLLGAALMVYGFFVTGMWPQILTGAALTAAIFIFKE